MKKILFLFINFLIIGMLNVNAETTTQKVEFVKCVDGDTAVFKVDEEEVKFRFLAIDTPETVHPTKAVEAFGKDASEYTCNKITNAKEILVEQESSNKTDKYGRSLAWIWVDGSLLQKELVSAGYAEVAYIYGNYEYTKSLCLVQSEAKTNQYGIWSDGTREEGYCSTVDLDGVENNIKYPLTSSEEDTSNDEETKVLEDSAKNLENISNQFEKFLESDNYEKFAIVLIVIVGAVTTFMKSKKKK